MKQLTVLEQHQVDFGNYNPACEGFVDIVKSMFIRDPDAKRREGFIKDQKESDRYNNYDIEKTLDKDLASTYNNPEWVEKHLAGNSGTTNIAALKIANVNAKQLTTPDEILKSALGMADVVREIARTEKPFIERRMALIKKISPEKDAAKVDAFWEAHAKDLLITASDRYRKKHKTPYPAMGTGNLPRQTWPIFYSNPSVQAFNAYLTHETDGTFVKPTPGNAQSFVKAIEKLVELSVEFEELQSKEWHVPYWDSSEAEYDELEHGDEIYDYLYSSQSMNEVFDLVGGVIWLFGRLIVGLYIAMYDKHAIEASK